MLKKLIIIEDGKEYQFETLELLVKALITEDFYEIDDKEKKRKMRIKAMANCLNNPMEIVEDLASGENIDGKFLIKDEITYILSLLLTNNIMLLERKDADIFAKNINKENMQDNYIIVNAYAKELLEKYISKC